MPTVWSIPKGSERNVLAKMAAGMDQPRWYIKKGYPLYGSLMQNAYERSLEERIMMPQLLKKRVIFNILQAFVSWFLIHLPPVNLQPESEICPDSEMEVPDHEENVNQVPPPPWSTGSLPVAPDPPAFLELDSDDDFVVENVLHCHSILEQDPSGQLLEWIVESKSNPTEEIHLAEDGLPFLKEPLKSDNVEQCYVLQVPLSRQDIIRWSQADKPAEMASVASASKRARSEVHIKDLNAKDRALFDIANDAELTCWIQGPMPWKPIEDESGNSQGRKAKARLVVLGFQDPNLTEVQREAPTTLTKEGRNTILQMISSFQWELSFFDIEFAFLRGKAGENLAMEPPPELTKKLQPTAVL
eukprot:symbB.v1.2.017133.t1/scaffold1268.1/size213459/14